MALRLRILSAVPLLAGWPASAGECGWELVPTRNGARDESSVLTDMVAIPGTHRAWGVGWHGLPVGGERPLIERWNGNEWSLATPPRTGTGARLDAVAARRRSDAWAVGSRNDQPLSIRWNGSLWRIVPTPRVRTGAVLQDVVATGAADAWAVGYRWRTVPMYRTLVLHRDGSSWTRVPAPNPGEGLNLLSGVVAVDPADVWAVGVTANDDFSQGSPLVLHWDGSQWSPVDAPGPSSANWSEVQAVSAMPDGVLWSVGYFEDQEGRHTLAMRYEGGAWSVVPTPSPGASGTREPPNPSYGPQLNAVAAGETGVSAVGNRLIELPASSRTFRPAPAPPRS